MDAPLSREELERLGKLALTSEHWRWASGVKDGSSGSLVAVAWYLDGSDSPSIRWVTDEDHLSEFCEIEGDEWPDFSNDATFGVLLGLNRRVWGRDDLVAERSRPVTTASTREWTVKLQYTGSWYVAVGKSQIEALVRALVVAPLTQGN